MSPVRSFFRWLAACRPVCALAAWQDRWARYEFDLALIEIFGSVPNPVVPTPGAWNPPATRDRLPAPALQGAPESRDGSCDSVAAGPDTSSRSSTL